MRAAGSRSESILTSLSMATLYFIYLNHACGNSGGRSKGRSDITSYRGTVVVRWSIQPSTKY